MTHVHGSYWNKKQTIQKLYGWFFNNSYRDHISSVKKKPKYKKPCTLLNTLTIILLFEYKHADKSSMYSSISRLTFSSYYWL